MKCLYHLCIEMMLLNGSVDLRARLVESERLWGKWQQQKTEEDSDKSHALCCFKKDMTANYCLFVGLI